MSIRLLALPAFVLSLAACSITPATPPSARNCNADAVKPFVGKPATPSTVADARKAAGAGMVRTLKPGQVVTMEYLEGRLNLHVDAGNVIVLATCG